jgi:hypothetical protein
MRIQNISWTLSLKISVEKLKCCQKLGDRGPISSARAPDARAPNPGARAPSQLPETGRSF